MKFIFANCLFKDNQQQQVQKRAKQYSCFCRVPALHLCKYVYKRLIAESLKLRIDSENGLAVNTILFCRPRAAHICDTLSLAFLLSSTTFSQTFRFIVAVGFCVLRLFIRSLRKVFCCCKFYMNRIHYAHALK